MLVKSTTACICSKIALFYILVSAILVVFPFSAFAVNVSYGLYATVPEEIIAPPSATSIQVPVLEEAGKVEQWSVTGTYSATVNTRISIVATPFTAQVVNIATGNIEGYTLFTVWGFSVSARYSTSPLLAYGSDTDTLNGYSTVVSYGADNSFTLTAGVSRGLGDPASQLYHANVSINIVKAE